MSRLKMQFNTRKAGGQEGRKGHVVGLGSISESVLGLWRNSMYEWICSMLRAAQSLPGSRIESADNSRHLSEAT